VTRVAIAPATVDDVETMVAAWVALADEQRQYGSHLLAESNRSAVSEDLSRRAVLDEALLARLAPEGADTGDGADRVTHVEVSVSPADLTGGTLPETFLGFVSFGLAVDGFERDVERGVVHNLYVRPGARSAGVGAALLAAAEDALAAAGADRVSLEALADNDRARSFYRAAGYREHRVELEKRLE